MSEKVFITKYNLSRILSKLRYLRIADDPIKKIMEDKYPFLMKQNAAYLSLLLQFMKDPYGFIDKYYEKWFDRKRFLFEHQPAYHYTLSCEFMQNAFEGIEIPNSFKTPVDYTEDLRKWESRISYSVRENRTEFINKCIDHFSGPPYNLKLNNSDFKLFTAPNSGIASYTNYTIDEIIEKIKKIVTEAIEFYNVPTNKIIVDSLKNYKKVSAQNEYPRPLGLPREQVKATMQTFENINTNFKNHVIEYIIKKFNSNYSFDITLLEKLNFKACNSCSKYELLELVHYNLDFSDQPVVVSSEIEINLEVDMPF